MRHVGGRATAVSIGRSYLSTTSSISISVTTCISRAGRCPVEESGNTHFRGSLTHTQVTEWPVSSHLLRNVGGDQHKFPSARMARFELDANVADCHLLDPLSVGLRLGQVHVTTRPSPVFVLVLIVPPSDF